MSSRASPEQRSSALSERTLRQLLRVALDRGYCRESWHAESGHPDRSISIEDVIYGLERRDWTLARPPNYDDEHRNWEYLIRTVDVEGDELHIKIAAFPSEKRIEIITRW